jgi:hypothetical protein
MHASAMDNRKMAPAFFHNDMRRLTVMLLDTYGQFNALRKIKNN